jgi:hypothetical protein
MGSRTLQTHQDFILVTALPLLSSFTNQHCVSRFLNKGHSPSAHPSIYCVKEHLFNLHTTGSELSSLTHCNATTA